MTKYNTESDLISLTPHKSTITEDDFLKLGFEKNHTDIGEKYELYTLKRNEESILMIRVQRNGTDYLSWIYKKDNDIKGFIHTVEDLKEIA